jgi:hypothetical protein
MLTRLLLDPSTPPETRLSAADPGDDASASWLFAYDHAA